LASFLPCAGRRLIPEAPFSENLDKHQPETRLPAPGKRSPAVLAGPLRADESQAGVAAGRGPSSITGRTGADAGGLDRHVDGQNAAGHRTRSAEETEVPDEGR
jgi:hypothetical protein